MPGAAADSPTSWEDVLLVIVRYVRDHHPEDTPLELELRLESGAKFRFPFPRAALVGPPCSHSPDFRSAVWFGIRYEAEHGFTPQQAAVVRRLWEARDSGNPDVEVAELKKASKSTATDFRVRDLFRGHKILADGVLHDTQRGVWRLRTPDEIE